MSKYRIDNPSGTTLDPYAFEKQFAQPNLNNPSPYSGVASQLEFVAPDKVDEGYGTMGNSGYAVQAINEAKAYNQTTLDLVGKGLTNVAKTVGIEIAKTPGYLGGVVGAVGNELIGDGKQSMSMIVDNAWVNAFESLDQNIKDAMPVYMSKQVQEGNLLDKLGSGAWWAETGADGLGFMLSMFVPGAIAKAAGVGAKLARVGEGIGNLAPKLGKLATGMGLLEDAGEAGFKYTQSFARNAGGYASAALNTTLESSAEAANTFDNLKNNYIQQGLSEEEAKQKAGEGAAAVFKGNMALLAISNYLDERWIWKSIGSAGEKEAGKELLSKVFKDGVVDMEALKQIPKEFGRAAVLKRTGQNILKNFAKEGFYEEGSQTTLQQNIEKGKKGEGVLDDLSNIATSYFDDFVNNTELQESIFLGGLLGGGASVIGTIQENNALRGALSGSTARTKDNSILAKYGILPETKDQKGFAKILAENHIKQFVSYKDLLDQQPDGTLRLNDQKLVDANLEQTDILRASILYDLSTAQGNKLGQEIFGQFLAANYVNGFLGQEGGRELFEEHANNQVLPAWQDRYLKTFNTDPSSKQSQEYIRAFKDSGLRIFDAHKQAENTNYPERYYHEKSQEYQDFRNDYFHKKFQTLVSLDSFKARRNQINNDMLEAGVSEFNLEDLSKITDPVKRQQAQEIKDGLKELKDGEEDLSKKYSEFYTKEGVKKMFDAFKNRKEEFNQMAEELKVANEELKIKVDGIPERNQAELERLSQITNDPNSKFRAKDGSRHTIEELKNNKKDISELGLNFDDISDEDFKNFEDTGNVSDANINKIAERIEKEETFPDREQAILASKGQEIEQILKAKDAQDDIKAAKDAGEVKSTTQEDINYDEIDEAIEAIEKKKGVNLYPSTGRNVRDNVVPIKNGLYVEEMTKRPSQKLWFETLDKEVSKNPTAYTVQVVRKDDKTNEELFKQIDRDAKISNSKARDLYIVLHKDGKPVIKEGNYVFSSLWEPDNLYPVEDGKYRFVLAEKTILENFKLTYQIKDLNKLSKKDKDLLDKSGIKDQTNAGLRRAAFFQSKQEYTEWYKSLQANPGQLQVAGITKGHALKMYSDENKTNRVWSNPLKGISGLKLMGNKLIGGKFEMSTTGVITVDDEKFTIPTGDVVIVDQNKNLHPMKARNLNSEEVSTVLYLLSLRDTKGPTEAITVEAPEEVIFGNIQMKQVPVFYNNKKSQKPRMNLIESFISFGSKDGKKGEIYFPRESIAKDPLLVWTDFEGVTKNIPVRLITEALKIGDFSKIQELVDFLGQKRFNVNEHLLGKSNESQIFSKPRSQVLIDTSGQASLGLEWDQTKTYFDHMLNDVLTTTTQRVEGYPDRVQRNLWFNKQPLEDKLDLSVAEEPTEPEERELTQQERDEIVRQNNESWERIKAKVAGDQTGVQERKDEKAKNDKAYQEELQKQKDHAKAQEVESKRVMHQMQIDFAAAVEFTDNAFYNQEHVKKMGLTKITPEETNNIIDVLYPGLRPGYVPLTAEKIEAIKKARSFDFVAARVSKSFAGRLANMTTKLVNEESKPSRRRAVKSLDEFKEDMDKILTTSDLLKAKIKSGEIIQNCK